MGEYEKIRDIIEKEIRGIQRSMLEHPERLSDYGVTYWKGNVAALNWALKELADVHLGSASK